LHRKFGSEVRFFVAGDVNTPSEVNAFCSELSNCVYLAPTDQEKWKCSELIGWRSIQRRNIALLEALAWGAEVIVSCDNDNLPIDEDYFRYFNEVLDPEQKFICHQPFNGLRVSSPTGWFDVGTLLDPIAPHRGFPISVKSEVEFTHALDAKIGVAAGICLGDPDTSAFYRIANHPTVHRVSEVLQAGIVVDLKTWTVFNSQATAIIREFAPAWAMWCGVSRYDDILASLVVQRVMRDRGYHVHFGKPFVLQQRNEHDLTKDLAGELWGMQNILDVARVLDAVILPNKSVIDDCRILFRGLALLGSFPEQTRAAAFAFLDDCEQVLG
jgi:hypothetical protein